VTIDPTELPATGSRRGGTVMRLRGLIRKEFLQIIRDPSSIAIAFLLPVVLLLLFGYGVSLDAEHVPIALVVENANADSSGLTGAFQQSRYFNPMKFSTMAAAEGALRSHQVDAIVWLRENFSTRFRQPGGAPIQVLVNGGDANNARMISGYIQETTAGWLEQWARTNGIDVADLVTVQPRVWFNAELRSRNFLVPGLIAVIMTLTGALLTALVMAREWERGTMEALMVTPVAVREILVGKLFPYFVLGTGGMALSVGMAVWVFDVPLRGSLWVLFTAGSLFLFAALGMGLLISIVAKNQFVAGQVAIIVTFLPAFILSGFLFDIGSMPEPIQVLTHLIAARYFVEILQSVFLAGDVWPLLIPNAVALILMAVVFLGLSRLKFQKRLE